MGTLICSHSAVLQPHVAVWDMDGPDPAIAAQGKPGPGLSALLHGPSIAALQPHVPRDCPSTMPFARGRGDLPPLLLSPLAGHPSSLLLAREPSPKASLIHLTHGINKRKFA